MLKPSQYYHLFEISVQHDTCTQLDLLLRWSTYNDDIMQILSRSHFVLRWLREYRGDTLAWSVHIIFYFSSHYSSCNKCSTSKKTFSVARTILVISNKTGTDTITNLNSLLASTEYKYMYGKPDYIMLRSEHHDVYTSCGHVANTIKIDG